MHSDAKEAEIVKIPFAAQGENPAIHTMSGHREIDYFLRIFAVHQGRYGDAKAADVHYGWSMPLENERGIYLSQLPQPGFTAITYWIPPKVAHETDS